MNKPIANPLARLSPAKGDLLILEFSKESVLTCDICWALEKLKPLSASIEAATRWEGCLTFIFAGWDDDPREISEIPEIRAWFAVLTREWPYWLHFSEKTGDTIGNVLRLLVRGRVIRKNGMVGWAWHSTEEIEGTLLVLFGRQNVMYDTLPLPESMNERITDEVSELLAAILE